LDSKEEIKKILEGANAWIAIDLPKTSIESYSKLAIDSGIKRFVVTTTLPNEDINQTLIPEFDAAISSFTTAGGAFTGIRHGEVIDGNEDNAYEIVNSTLPCLDNYVERGVLARVVTELLCITDSCNSQCGLSSSGSFAAAYLNVLRSSGLNRFLLPKLHSILLIDLCSLTVLYFIHMNAQEAGGGKNVLRGTSKSCPHDCH